MLQSGSISIIWSLIELQDEFGATGPVAEIGVHQGRTLLLLCHALNHGERAIGIDMFGRPPGSNEADKAALAANFDRFGLGAENYSIFTADSAALGPDDLTEMFGGKKVRLFSVDGDHSKAAVIHDLTLAASVLSDDGVIIADDLFNPWYPTVTEAIYEFFRTDAGDLQPIAFAAANGPVETGAAKLFIARASHAPDYKAGLKLLNQDDLKHCDAFAGHADVPTFYFSGQPQRRTLDGAVRDILREILAEKI